jgi:hypothetical protein
MDTKRIVYMMLMPWQAEMAFPSFCEGQYPEVTKLFTELQLKGHSASTGRYFRKGQDNNGRALLLFQDTADI